jgi:hypothetical protein
MIVWQFYGQGGMNDTAILALVQMLRDFPWPSAVGPVTVTASKSVSDVTGSYCAVSTNPPAFN